MTPYPGHASSVVMLLLALASTAGLFAEDRIKPTELAPVPLPVAKAIVIVEGDKGSGTGFFARWRDGLFVITNAHVIGNNTWLKLITADGEHVRPTAMHVAVAHDIFLLRVDDAPAALDVPDKVDELVKVRDRVLVAGNALGDGVIGGLSGQILGIGPDRIEIDCRFVPGNSGSPIILESDNSVLGIATYAMIRTFDPADKLQRESPFSEVRRFGYRLDSVREWQQVTWTLWADEAERIQRLSDFSDTLYAVARDYVVDARVDGRYRDGEIESAVATYQGLLRRGTQVDPRVLKSQTAFLFESLRIEAERDLKIGSHRFVYDFHRRQVERELPFREALAKYFAEMRELNR